MSSRESIYVSHGTDVSEVERAVRLCLRADWNWVMAAESPRSEAWQDWLHQGVWSVLAAHVTNVYALAERSAAAEIVAMDVALAGGLLSTYAQAKELPTTNDPLRRALLRAVQRQQMPGQQATFCAVAAQRAFLPLLVALQSAFFLEWRARQQRLQDATISKFIIETNDFCIQLRTFLNTHETPKHPLFGVR